MGEGGGDGGGSRPAASKMSHRCRHHPRHCGTVAHHSKETISAGHGIFNIHSAQIFWAKKA